MKVKIDRMDHQGRGISILNDKVVFIPNTLPGEEVDIKITRENKKYSEAKVEEYITKSIDRIELDCPYYEICGGCHLRHISYENELKYKENKIHDIIKKFTSYDTKLIKPIISNDKEYYRNKVTFHVDKQLGFYNIKSKNIVEVDRCLLVDKNINEVIEEIKNINLDNVYEIVIRSSKNLKEKMLVLKLKEKENMEYLKEQLKSFNTIITYYNKKYEVVSGSGYIYDQIGDYTYKISPDSFFQVNTDGALKLYNKVLEYLKPTKTDDVLDLYCGTGTIGIHVSKYVKSVKGVEINKYAVIDANNNKEINKIKNIEFECLDAKDVMNVKDKFSKIIIDPPRSGLDKKTIEYIRNKNVESVVYVSCDPITFARDVELLKDKYELVELTPVDMFPRTYHCEIVAYLERIKNENKR